MNIGTKIKNLRVLNGLTQEELAVRCDLTKGFISQLENNNNEPSISTLTDILRALGTNLRDFFNDEEDNQVVFTKDDYFVNKENTHEITWLIPNSQKNDMEPILVTIMPNSSLPKDMPHEGQEFGYVLKGKIKLVVGNNVHSIKAGESFYYKTNKVHYLINQSNDIAKVMWISTPPNF